MRGRQGRCPPCIFCARISCDCPERPTGFIYFLRSDYKSLIKIGFSRDKSLVKRMAVLKNMNAAPFEVLRVVRSTMLAEKRLHRAFAHCRFNAEWFLPDVALLELVLGLDQYQVFTLSMIKK